MDQICYCKQVGKITTSWTDSNPGRKFIGCEQYGVLVAISCGLIPQCVQDQKLSYLDCCDQLIGRHEAEKKMLNKKNTRLVVALAMSWCFFFCLVLCLLAY